MGQSWHGQAGQRETFENDARASFFAKMARHDLRRYFEEMKVS